jgi:hypothetical protein
VDVLTADGAAGAALEVAVGVVVAGAARDVPVDVPVDVPLAVPVDVPVDVPVAVPVAVAVAETAAVVPVGGAAVIEPVPGRGLRWRGVTMAGRPARVLAAATWVALVDRCAASASWWPTVPPVRASVRVVAATRRRRAVELRSSGR